MLFGLILSKNMMEMHFFQKKPYREVSYDDKIDIDVGCPLDMISITDIVSEAEIPDDLDIVSLTTPYHGRVILSDKRVPGPKIAVHPSLMSATRNQEGDYSWMMSAPVRLPYAGLAKPK